MPNSQQSPFPLTENYLAPEDNGAENEKNLGQESAVCFLAL